MDNNIDNRLQAVEYELSQIAESEYLDELKQKFKGDVGKDVVVNIIPSRDISFKTKSLLEDILRRLVLTQDDRRDLQRYIEFGGGDNIDAIRNNLEIFVQYKDRILSIIEGAPEEFDTLVELYDYLKKFVDEYAAKLNDITTNLDSLKTNVNNKANTSDILLKRGSVNSSITTKLGNNGVYSEYSESFGRNNTVGLKGWYYKALRFNKTDNLLYVFFSKNGQVRPIVGLPSVIETIPMQGFWTGMIMSVVNDSKYDNAFKLKEIHTEYIILQPISGELPFTTIVNETTLEPEDYSIYSLDYPNAGMYDLGPYSFAAGRNNKAINGTSTAFGYANKSYGKFSFTEGRNNTAAYCSHTEGQENINDGQRSHVEGYLNKNYKNHSHVEGNLNINRGATGHIEGRGNVISDDAKDIPTGTAETPTDLAYSHVEGLSNEIRKGYAGHVEGMHNILNGNYGHIEGNQNTIGTPDAMSNGAHAEGVRNVVNASGAHAEGADNVVNAGASHSHVEGRYNKVNNPREHAEGLYNKSNTGNTDADKTLHSVGIGTSDTNRKNAHEIMYDGKHYVLNVGNYKGDNTAAAKDLATVINEIDTKSIKKVAQTLTAGEKNIVRSNINAQEKLVSGVNIATINGKSLLYGDKILDVLNINNSVNGGTTYYYIDWDYVSDNEFTTESGGDTYYVNSGALYKLCLGDYHRVTIGRGMNIPELNLVYSGSSFPDYDYDIITSYYRAPNWILICEGSGYNVYQGINKIKLTLKKVGYE